MEAMLKFVSDDDHACLYQVDNGYFRVFILEIYSEEDIFSQYEGLANITLPFGVKLQFHLKLDKRPHVAMMKVLSRKGYTPKMIDLPNDLVVFEKELRK